jgi:hypothetical protein
MARYLRDRIERFPGQFEETVKLLTALARASDDSAVHVRYPPGGDDDCWELLQAVTALRSLSIYAESSNEKNLSHVREMPQSDHGDFILLEVTRDRLTDHGVRLPAGTLGQLLGKRGGEWENACCSK